jgi:hypothetical protein
MPPTRGIAVIRSVGFWLGGIAAGFAAWEEYEATPGAVAKPASNPRPIPNHWSLVMFVHPHCPYSRSGVMELEELIRIALQPIDTEVAISLSTGKRT